MLKNIFLVLLLISSMAFAEYQAKVETDVLNVRAKRSASSHVISKLNKGDEITVYSCEKGFCEIAFGLKKGYVSENLYLQLREIPSLNQQRVITNLVKLIH